MASTGTSATSGSGRLRSVLVGEVKTAEFALRGLLDAGHPPDLIYTTDVQAVMERSGMNADYYCDLRSLGKEAGIPVRLTSDLTAEAPSLAGLSPTCIWVMGWPYIVRTPVLEVAPCIGMHPTRLPKRRGGAPMNWTILDAEPTGCVSLFRMREGLDNGELLAQQDFPISDSDYVGDVADRIYEITRALVADRAPALASGLAEWTEQDGSEATYTRRRNPDDGKISWSDSSKRIRDLVRATSRPFPGAWSWLGDVNVRVWRAEIPVGYRAPLKAAPGEILEVTGGRILVSTRDNALLLTDVEVEGDLDLQRSVGSVLGR